MKNIILAWGFFLTASACLGQPFLDVREQLGIAGMVVGGDYSSGVSFVDFDHDGKDDISLGLVNASPRFFRNSENGFIEEFVG
ncbi:MAG: hypothetical protein RL226_2064, partial [Bacteroidota bacterium]